MIQVTICLDLLLLFGGNTCVQEYELPRPNTLKIQQQLIDNDYEKEAIYYYLINNFKQVSELYETKSMAWDTDILCSFEKDFEEGIHYSMDECGERGAELSVTFPTLEGQEIRNWIEQIHSIYESKNDKNIWSDDHLVYHPSDMRSGCYYQIEATRSATTVRIYCGC
jgi:hypothetical protein